MPCQIYTNWPSRDMCGRPATYSIDCEPTGPISVIIDVCDEHALSRLKARDFAYIYPIEEESEPDERAIEDDHQEARLQRWEASREEW